MKILVAVKRVVDYNVKVRARPDGSGVELANVKMAINPFCEIAVEEAIRLKERGVATEVVAVSIGPQVAQEQIRSSLALGADRGILVKTDTELEPLAVAKCLKALCEREQPDILLLGKQSIDGDNNQTGQILGALTGYPQGTFASELAVADGAVEVTREVDAGLQTLKLTLPAIITADLRLNEPRYAALPNIMKARSKPLATTSPEELGVDCAPRTALLEVAPPARRQAGVKVADVAELVNKLKNEAKVI